MSVFGPKTVASAVASLTKALAQLEEVVSSQFEELQDLEAKKAEIVVAIWNAENEREKAERIKAKLTELLS